jgi:putative transposase
MTTHLHLAIQVADIKIIQNLAFRYTRWIYRQQHRVWHKVLPAEADNYLLELVGYIDLHSVRAGLVNDLADYAWSGRRAYLGRDTIPWLTTHWVLSLLASQESTARR